MKNTAYLINVSRGGEVDEAELIQALEAGQIAGAGLDVSDPEPADPDNPLFHMDNVILTPHCGAASQESMERMATESAQAVCDFFRGKEPEHRIV